MTESTDLGFLKEHRWDLAKSHLERSDQVANLLRGVLFTAAAASMGFVMHQKPTGDVIGHCLALVLFAAAICVVFWSWDRQKGKAIRRFRALATNDLEAYENQDEFPNFTLDRWAGGLILAGYVVEIMLYSLGIQPV